MKCEEAQLLLDLHLDGNLPQELVDRLERHLIRCSRCAGELRALEQARALLREAVGSHGALACLPGARSSAPP